MPMARGLAPGICRPRWPPWRAPQLSYLTLIVGLLALTALSACGPAPANPQVKGDNSTISGDKADTRANQTGQLH
jgi:hypothetical protein